MKVSVGISNRHVHLTAKDIEVLFGIEYELNNIGSLTQPGQYKCEETVTIKTGKSEINNVRVLGPERNYTQVEISRTDSYKLGINPPVRNSGDIKNSAEVTIIGPSGSIKKECCILATRHIHVSKKQLDLYGLSDKKTVNILIPGEKGGIISNVYIKPSEQAFFELHLDTDDANAHGLKNGDIVEIISEV